MLLQGKKERVEKKVLISRGKKCFCPLSQQVQEETLTLIVFQLNETEPYLLSIIILINNNSKKKIKCQ